MVKKWQQKLLETSLTIDYETEPSIDRGTMDKLESDGLSVWSEGSGMEGSTLEGSGFWNTGFWSVNTV